LDLRDGAPASGSWRGRRQRSRRGGGLHLLPDLTGIQISIRPLTFL
jgi:hypothetical protein